MTPEQETIFNHLNLMVYRASNMVVSVMEESGALKNIEGIPAEFVRILMMAKIADSMKDDVVKIVEAAGITLEEAQQKAEEMMRKFTEHTEKQKEAHKRYYDLEFADLPLPDEDE